MSQYASSLDAIIIGAGPAGIAMAYQLKHALGFQDFTVYDKLDGVGGTWRTNTYPGWYVGYDGFFEVCPLLLLTSCSGCDLPSHLYSFSFNLNPNWSQELCEQPEILKCTRIPSTRSIRNTTADSRDFRRSGRHCR